MKRLFAFSALIVLFASVLAVTVDAPGTIHVYEKAKEAAIYITNQSQSIESFSIEFNAPARFELSASSGSIAAGETKKVYLTIQPDESLNGQTYENMLEVRVGDEKVVRKIRIAFRETNESQGTHGTEFNPAGFFALPAISSGLALNIALAIVAAILLIAFIARFVKRMEGH